MKEFTKAENIECTGQNPIKVEGSGLSLNGKPVKSGDVITLNHGDILDVSGKNSDISVTTTNIIIS